MKDHEAVARECLAKSTMMSIAVLNIQAGKVPNMPEVPERIKINVLAAIMEVSAALMNAGVSIRELQAQLEERDRLSKEVSLN